jgi:hypothetical protein
MVRFTAVLKDCVIVPYGTGEPAGKTGAGAS